MRRSILFLYVFGTSLVLTTMTVNAQSHCAGQTQRDINICAHQKWIIADQELNRIWQDLKPRMDARGEGGALLEQQRAWLKKRDATCDPERTLGGSAAAMIYWSCMEEMTLERNAALRALGQAGL